MSEPLDGLTVGMPIVFGGNRVARVSAELAADFRRGDQLVVVQTTGDLLHVRSVDQAIVNTAVHAASAAFAELASVDDAAITAFFDRFAAVFDSDELFEPIARANDADVASAQARGRSTTRLELGGKMRADMAAALRLWRDVAPMRDDGVIERVEHELTGFCEESNEERRKLQWESGRVQRRVRAELWFETQQS